MRIGTHRRSSAILSVVAADADGVALGGGDLASGSTLAVVVDGGRAAEGRSGTAVVL